MNMQENFDETMSSCQGGKCPYKLDCLRHNLHGFNPHELKAVPYDSKKRDCEHFIHKNQTKLNI